MESFNPHEYVPRRLDAPAKFLLWDFDLVASGIAGLAFGIIVNSLLMGAIASYAAHLGLQPTQTEASSRIRTSLPLWQFLSEPLSALRHPRRRFLFRITEDER